MTLPRLSDWNTTRDALHQIALVMSAIRVASSDPLDNDLQYSLAVIDGGLSTAQLNIGGELVVDFRVLSLNYVHDDGRGFAIDITGHSQKSLMQAVLEAFQEFGISLDPSMKHITREEVFAPVTSIAQDYAIVMDAVYTALARFRAKLAGCMTPLVVWAHHFDMAFLWFATRGANEHSDPHVAIGFAPFSDGIDRPYFYGYAWSQETDYIQVELDAPAQAITGGYTGLYAEYDKLRTVDNFDQVIETMYLLYHRKVTTALLQD